MERDTVVKVTDTLSPADEEKDIVLAVTDGSFRVGTTEPMESEANATFTLSEINIRVKRGEILAVVGPVASGKSTLLQGILGDVQCSNDTKILLPNESTCSYAAQSPFILSTTVRENILFGSPFVEEKYERILDACCLRPDLLQWPAGDLTEIGERGVTMSGGQKQRVSVARAVYSNADIGLFDDVLSALDSGTSQTLFENLFGNIQQEDSLLHNSGIILVTHAQHVLRRVDKILVLDEGRPIFHGDWNELQAYTADSIRHCTTLLSMQSSLQLSATEDVQSSKYTTGIRQSLIADDVDKSKGEIKTIEQREHGTSSIDIWLLWFQYTGGVLFITVQIILMAADRGLYVAIDWWLAVWTSSARQSITVFGHEFPNQYEGISAQVPYLLVYTVIVVCMTFFLILRSQWAVYGGIRACKKVFSNMTHCVLHAPMSYFDGEWFVAGDVFVRTLDLQIMYIFASVTPLGRVISRFTYDVEQVDITLAQFMSIFLIASSWLVAGQVVMITIVPYMAIINAVVLTVYVVILRHYRWSASDLQRLDAVSRSPIQASLAEGLDGSFTIRAYEKVHFFAYSFQTFIDENSSAMLNFVASRRWLAVRLETLGAFVTLSASLAITVFNEQLGLSAGNWDFVICIPCVQMQVLLMLHLFKCA